MIGNNTSYIDSYPKQHKPILKHEIPTLFTEIFVTKTIFTLANPNVTSPFKIPFQTWYYGCLALLEFKFIAVQPADGFVYRHKIQ